MASGFVSPLGIAQADGPTLTAASAASCLPVTSKFTFPPNTLVPGTLLRVVAWGRISNAVTTPGTARMDLRLGGTVILDTGALILNQVAKTTIPWRFEAEAVCRAVGTTGNFFGFASFQSESIVGSGLASVGGSGSLLSASASGPETAPAVGANVDLTVANAFDCFFTQTVATGSFTVHIFRLMSTAIATT